METWLMVDRCALVKVQQEILLQPAAMYHCMDHPERRHKTVQHKESKFVLRVNSEGIKLTEGKLPTRHQQLWDGECTKGRKVQACFDEDVGLTFYWN